MKTAELKNILISQINNIDDNSFLDALKTIIDSKVTSSKNYLKEYNNELLVAEEEIEKGEYLTHNQVKESISEWKKK